MSMPTELSSTYVSSFMKGLRHLSTDGVVLPRLASTTRYALGHPNHQAWWPVKVLNDLFPVVAELAGERGVYELAWASAKGESVEFSCP
jgi:hypothetical protein